MTKLISKEHNGTEWLTLIWLKTGLVAGLRIGLVAGLRIGLVAGLRIGLVARC